MAKLRVKKGKIPIKALQQGETLALQQFSRIADLAKRAIEHVLDKAQPHYDQHEMIGASVLRKSKGDQIREARALQEEKDSRRRKIFGAPNLDERAMKGRIYRIQSHQEPLAKLARMWGQADFTTAAAQRETHEEEQAKYHALARSSEYTSCWVELLSKLGDQEAVGRDPKLRSLELAAGNAARLYASVHDQWERKREVFREAYSLARQYAIQDNRMYTDVDYATFWAEARD